VPGTIGPVDGPTGGPGWGTWAVIGKDHAVDIRNPATGEVLTTIESLTAAQTDTAIAKAAAAFEEWRAVAPGDRARLLRRFAAAVDADIVQLAALEVINAGHVVGNARWEAGNVRDVIEFYSGAPERHFHAEFPAHVLIAGLLFRDPVSPRELSRVLRVLLDDAGGDAIDAHTLGAVGFREILRHRGDRRLERGVGDQRRLLGA